ncbi:unnamed protein product [Rhizophagus irregularis]|nr:unnamed protein product [Rhizophagus irregularis]
MTEETYEYADSVFSESSSEPSFEPSENTLISNVELNEGNTYSSEKEFIFAVKAYAKQEGFQVRLGKSEKNSAGKIRKRTIICSREGKPLNTTGLKKRNRPSQRCNCQFSVRASLNSSNGLWYLIFLRLEHNHSMVSENSRRFMSEERTIPIEIQERILLLRRAGCNVPTIRAILKEEFSNIVTWIYDDLYNFIYQKEGTNREFDSDDFVKELERLKSQDSEFCYELLINPETNELQQAIWMFPEQKMNYCRFNDVVVFDNTYKTNRFGMPFGIFTGVNNHGQSVCFADEDQAIIKAVDLVFVPHGTKHALCLWHLMKNLVKNLNGTLGFKWAEFIKFFYQCLDEYEEDGFLEKWNQLKTEYPLVSKYLEKMDKNLRRWAPCCNRQLFMADMTTTQRGESMNSLMKGYMDATTSLTNFLKAFESALEQRKDDREFAKFYEDNKVISLLTANPHEKQASELLTKYAFKKTQQQLSQCMSYKSEKINSDNDEIEVSFCVERFGSQKKGRIVKYDLKNNHFSCSCYYTNFSGIICRHIFKVATQLNLEEIPLDLFPIRWRKDPDEIVLVKMYKIFYSTNGELGINRQDENTNIAEENDSQEDYDLYVLKENSKPQNHGKIKNPEIIRPKGTAEFQKKRIRSTLETNKPSKRPVLASHQQNTYQEKEIDLQGNKCPFCTEFLPYPLPSRIRLLLSKIAKQDVFTSKSVWESFPFCRIVQDFFLFLGCFSFVASESSFFVGQTFWSSLSFL